MIDILNALALVPFAVVGAILVLNYLAQVACAGVLFFLGVVEIVGDIVTAIDRAFSRAGQP
ncbi:hypothetical protein [Methylorubrum thiocyanatum]|uniref:hypothetical protein n=1 Tax=Methylorubrum thiocyanatum TaxID=47958 RepID=UPI003F80326B